MLEVKNLCVSFGDTKILKDITFKVEPGDWLMIIGPNGSGKTTITNSISQSIPYTGEILIHGNNAKAMKPKDRAKELGVLMQNHYVSYSYTVRDVISLGNYSRSGGIFSQGCEIEEEKIKKALSLTGMEDFQYRSVLTLSGGELQRVFLSQLLLQNPKLMILDEPTNHLDLVYQESIFNLIKHWKKTRNRAVISVVHDLRLARMYGNKALLLKNGEIFSFGKIEDVMNRENLKKVYNLDVYEWMNKLNENWNM